MLKCPIHDLPHNIVINNFYARLSGHYKDYLDACFEGSFISKEVEAKLDLLETIQGNIEDWDCDKGKELGINYEYDCIKSFAKTADFKSLVLNMALILKLWLIALEPLLLILMFPKEIGMCIMNLLKTLA
jgi:hypothetical protein